MFDWIVLGLIQGVTEWLPVSSEGALVLAQVYLLGSTAGVGELIRTSLWLHMGTWLAVVIYYRRDLWKLSRFFLLSAGASQGRNDTERDPVINFLIVATLISGVLGFGLLKLLEGVDSQVELAGKTVTIGVGVLLLVTGWLQLRSSGKKGGRKESEMNNGDSAVLGVAQGLAAMPGFSRSGLTVSALLLRGVNKESALRLSFLLSVPIVLAGNILLNLGEGVFFTLPAMAGLLAAFVSGFVTIHLMMKIAQKVNFGYFVIGFGVLSLAAGLV